MSGAIAGVASVSEGSGDALEGDVAECVGVELAAVCHGPASRLLALRLVAVGGEQRVVCDAVDAPWDAAAGQGDALDGAGFEQGGPGAGELQAVLEVGADLHTVPACGNCVLPFVTCSD